MSQEGQGRSVDADGNMVISDRVRELRRRHGVTQENLAERSEVSLAVIKKIEQGGSARMETYHQIARALGVNTIMFVAPDSPEPVEQNLDDAVLAPIRSAINPPHGLDGGPVYGTADGDEADLGRLRRALSAMATACHADRSDDLGGDSALAGFVQRTTMSSSLTPGATARKHCACGRTSPAWPGGI